MARLRSVLQWAAVAGWMVVIFTASSDRHSWEHSSRFIEPVVRWLFPSASDYTVRVSVLFVRKCAHVTEFAVLTLLVWWALSRNSSRTPMKWRRSTAGVVFAFVVLCAVVDEFHQSYVPTRQGSAVDVVVDSSGAILALLFLRAITRWQELRSGIIHAASDKADSRR